MIRINQKGAASGLLLALVLVSGLFAATLAFAGWAFMSQQDYKSNSDKKAAAAVALAEEKLTIELEAKFAEDNKSPLKSYEGPQTLGSVKFTYPKTWSVYEVKKESGDKPLDIYFHPSVVPEVSAQVSYALRVQILNDNYADQLKSFQTSITQNKLSAEAYLPANISGAQVGVKLTGQVVNNKTGVMILLPVRDKTLKIWTESESFEKDLNDHVLTGLTYNP